MLRVAALFRHPVKSIGIEELRKTEVRANQCFPLDRVWALEHEAAKPGAGWRHCANFIRVTKAQSLMAVRVSADGPMLTFRHPDRPDLTIDPNIDGAALVDWVRPLCNPGRAAPEKLTTVPGIAMTDVNYPSISILNLASLRALSQKAGRTLDPRRFRGNIWFDGGAPWQEFEWIGQTIHINGVPFKVEERIERCVATHANPETGQADTDVLGLLDAGWDHRDFGVYAVAQGSGTLSIDDEVRP